MNVVFAVRKTRHYLPQFLEAASKGKGGNVCVYYNLFIEYKFINKIIFVSDLFQTKLSLHIYNLKAKL